MPTIDEDISALSGEQLQELQRRLRSNYTTEQWFALSDAEKHRRLPAQYLLDTVDGEAYLMDTLDPTQPRG
jgi:hypothetical protein